MHSHRPTGNCSYDPDKRALIKAFVENKGMAEAVKSFLLFDRFISTLDRTIPDAE